MHLYPYPQSSSRVQTMAVEVGALTQVPRQLILLQELAKGKHVSVACEQVVTVFETRQADVGPGGAVVMQAPCHGWPAVDDSVGVQSSGEGQVGVLLIMQGVWYEGDVVIQAPCHGFPEVDISVGVQSSGLGHVGVALMTQGVRNGGGGGVFVHTPCHGLFGVEVSVGVQVKPVGQLGDPLTTQLVLGEVVVMQVPRQLSVWHVA
jgi:hypothetical protein